jgi:hypothetical protein
VILVGAAAAGSAALASDAHLQKALFDSGCAAPRIETVLQQSDLVASKERYPARTSPPRATAASAAVPPRPAAVSGFADQAEEDTGRSRRSSI